MLVFLERIINGNIGIQELSIIQNYYAYLHLQSSQNSIFGNNTIYDGSCIGRKMKLTKTLQNYRYPLGLLNLITQYAEFAVSLERTKQINAEKLTGLEEKIKKEMEKYFTHAVVASAITALSIGTMFLGSEGKETISYLLQEAPHYDSVGLVTYGLKAAGHMVEALRYIAPLGTVVGGIHTLRSIYLLSGIVNIDWKTNDALRDYGSKSEKLKN